MLMRLRRVGVWSYARIAGLTGLAIGLVIGAVYFLIGLVVGGAGAFGDAGMAPAFLGLLFGAGALVFMPLLYGAIGLVFGAFYAWVYNMAAGAFGGVELDLDRIG